MQEGRLWFDSVSARERQVLKEFLSKDNVEEILRCVVGVNSELNLEYPKLRVLDWTLTNFCKTTVEGMKHYYAYEASLRKYRRLLFDAFRRGSHVFFNYNETVHYTTAGQINFVSWCLKRGILPFIEKNIGAIRASMPAKSPVPSAKRKREITPQARVSVFAGHSGVRYVGAE